VKDAKCQCDDQCAQYDDCCPDYATLCPIAGKTDAECAETSGCKAKGLCKAAGGKCVAKTATDCSASVYAKFVDGFSKADGVDLGHKVVVKDGRCRLTASAKEGCKWPCWFFGLCVEQSGVCAAVSSKDCAEAMSAWTDGWNTAQDGDCVAASDADCKKGFKICEDASCPTWSACASEGTCAAEDGVCVASSDSECKASNACKNNAQCTLSGKACVATAVSDCNKSDGCKQDGACGLKGGKCVPTAESDCALSTSCKYGGDCKLGVDQYGQPKCKPGSTKDCAKSSECSVDYKCAYDGWQCSKKSCVPGGPCPEHLMCNAASTCVSLELQLVDLTVVSAIVDIAESDGDGSAPDPYVCLEINDKKIGCTATASNTYLPTWNKTFTSLFVEPGDKVVFRLNDEDPLFNDQIDAVQYKTIGSALSAGGDSGPMYTGSKNQLTWKAVAQK